MTARLAPDAVVTPQVVGDTSRPSVDALGATFVDLHRARQLAAAVAAQTAVVSALLYFFGWQQAQAYYSYYGVSTGLLDLGTKDYLLRSVSLTVPTLIGVVTGAALVVAVVLPVLRTAGRWPRRVTRGVVLGLLVAAGLLGLAAAFALLGDATWGLRSAARPLLVVASVIFLGLGCWTAAVAQLLRHRLPWQAVSAAVTVGAVAVFWSWTLFARDAGRQLAAEGEKNLPERTAVSLYAMTRLGISGRGVSVTYLHGGAGDYDWRYDGLRLLIKSDGKWFLLPQGWRRGDSAVFVIPDRDSIRVDLVAGQR